MTLPADSERWELGEHVPRLLEQSRQYKGESLWQDAWRRLRRNRSAFGSLVFLALFGVTAVLAPLLPIPSPIALTLQTEPVPPDWPWGATRPYEDERFEPGTRPTRTHGNLANDGWRHRALLHFRSAAAGDGPELEELVREATGRSTSLETRAGEDPGSFEHYVSIPLRSDDAPRIDYRRTGRQGRLRAWSVKLAGDLAGDGDAVVYELELDHDPGPIERWSVEQRTWRGKLYLVPAAREAGVHGLRYDFSLARRPKGTARLLVLNGEQLPLGAPEVALSSEPPADLLLEIGDPALREFRRAREKRGVVHDDLERRMARALDAATGAGHAAGTEFVGAKFERGYWELGAIDRAMLRVRGDLFGLWQTGNWMGSDAAGRDILARIVWGSRTSILVALAAASCSLIIGVIYGAFSGLAGGRVDNLMMRVVDILYSVPFVFVVIFLITVVNEYRTELEDVYGIDRELIFYVVIGAIYWLTMARVVRGQVLSLKNTEFIEAARVLGASTGRILFAHIVPNVLSVVIVYLTLTIPAVMLFEAFLSFLGLGIEPPKVSWGLLAVDGQEAVNRIHVYWWLVLFPALAMGSTLLALNVLGDGLRDALDPKLRGKD